jgi:hypothetical protein
MPYGTPVPSLPRSEEAFRELVSARGIVPPGAFAPPAREATFAVFAQRPDACLDIEVLQRQAERFFGAKLGLTVDKHYGDDRPESDAARVVVAANDGTASGIRLCVARPTTPSDLAAAEAAERAQGTHGLALLAQRCPTLWLVVPETEEDRAALTISAVFASVFLGPILAVGGQEIYGVRTARMKLEGSARPYR